LRERHLNLNDTYPRSFRITHYVILNVILNAFHKRQLHIIQFTKRMQNDVLGNVMRDAK